MNINDLLKLDIKDLQKIDYKKLAEELAKRPDLLINAVAAVVTLVIFFNIISSRQKESKTLKDDIKKMKEKVEAIQEHKNTQNKLDEFISTIPKSLPEEAFVNTLTDWAAKRHIQIESFSPTRTESNNISDTITIELMLSINNYKDLWLFINDIEKSPYALRINDWQGYMVESYESSRGRQGKKDKKKLIKTRLSLSTVKIKNE